MKQFKILLDKFVGIIFKSGPDIPKNIYCVVTVLLDAIRHKYPQETTARLVIGGMFFLRFLCPAIVTPETLGIGIYCTER